MPGNTGTWRPAASRYRAIDADPKGSDELALREVDGREREQTGVAGIQLLLLLWVRGWNVVVGKVAWVEGHSEGFGWLEIGGKISWVGGPGALTVVKLSGESGAGCSESCGGDKCGEGAVRQSERML